MQDQKPNHYYSLSSLSVNDDLRTNVNMQVERYSLGNVLVKGTVEHIIPVVEREDEENDRTKERDTEGEATRATERMRDGGRRRLKHFQVHLHGGIVLKAHRVIMATGPTRAQMANIPSWVKNVGESYPEERLQHTVHLMHSLPRSKQEHDQRDTFPSQGKSYFKRVNKK